MELIAVKFLHSHIREQPFGEKPVKRMAHFFTSLVIRWKRDHHARGDGNYTLCLRNTDALSSAHGVRTRRRG